MTKRAPPSPALATALKMLRMRAGRTLKEIEPTVGVTQQAMSRWENGTATFPEDKIPLYLRALDQTAEAHEREMAIVAEAPQGLYSHGDAPWWAAYPADLERFDVPDESMAPFCEPGEMVLFARDKKPTRMGACVVDFKDGTRIIRQYIRESDGQIHLHRVNPDCTESYLATTIVATHRVVLRGA